MIVCELSVKDDKTCGVVIGSNDGVICFEPIHGGGCKTNHVPCNPVKSSFNIDSV